MLSTKSNLPPEELANYANAIAISATKLIVVFVEGILAATIINILIMVLWHVGWKRIIPKEKRKETYHKKRWISGLEDVLVGFVCGAMIIFPLTSIVNSFSSGFNKVKDEDKASLKANNETYAQISDVLDAYDDSLFAKVFFAWTKNEKGQTYDSALTSWLTQGDYQGAEVSLVSEVQSFTKIGSLALEGGLLSNKGVSAEKFTLFLVSDYAPELLRAVASSGLLTKLMPYALTLVTSLKDVEKYLKTNEGIDYRDFDYPATFDKLADLYQDVIDSSFADAVVDENGKLKDVPSIIKGAFTGTAVAPMGTLLNAFDGNELKLVDALLSAAAYCTACQETANPPENGVGIKSFLPKFVAYDADGDKVPDAIPDAYKEIQWGKQLALIYDGLMSFSQIDSDFLDTILSGFSSDGYRLSDENSKKLMSICLDNAGKFGPILYGGSSFSGILDSCFLCYGFPTIMDFLQDGVNSAFSLTGDSALDLSPVSAALTEDSTGNDLSLPQIATSIKGEARSLFDVLTTMTDYTADGKHPGKEFLADLDAMPGLYFSPKDGNTLIGADKGLLTALSSGLALLDNSKIATAVMPPLFDHFLSDSNPFSSLGVDFKFNFHCANLGQELAKMVNIYRDSEDLIAFSANLGGETLEGDALANALKGFASYSTELSTLLTGLATSAILNPDITDSSDSIVHNSNITSLLTYLLKSSFGDYTVEITSILSKMDASDTAEEMTSIVNFLNAASESGIFSVLNSFKSNPTDLSSLTAVDFEMFFGKANSSRLFSSLLGDIMDKETFQNEDAKAYLGTSLTEDGSISFKNITDWAKEGKALNALIKAASEIGDLKNIDYFSSDPVAVANIIKALSSSGIFLQKQADGTTKYLFSDYMAEKLVTSIKDNANIASYFADYGTNDQFSVLTANFKNLETAANWSEEADALGNVIGYTERLGGFDVLQSGGDLRKVNVLDVENLLDSISSSKALGQVVTYHVYLSINSSLVSSGLTAFDASNLPYIYNASNSGRSYENAQLSRLLEAVLNPSGKDAFGNLTYALLDDSTGQIASDKLKSIDDIDASFTLRPILSAMASSHVFNTLKENDDGSYGVLTAFEKEISSVLNDYGIYSSSVLTDRVVSSIAPDQITYTEAQEQNRFTRWGDEISSLCQVINDIQGLHLDFTHFSLSSLFPSSNPTLAGGNRPKLESFLNDIADSGLLYPALPSKMSAAIDSIDSSLGGASNTISLAGSNVYYPGSIALTNGDILVDAPYGEDENESLSYVIMNASLLGNDVSFDDLSSLNVGAAGDLLNYLARSHVFNSTSDGASTTVFQKILAQALSSEGIKDVYYSAGNPKDILSSASYSDASTKAIYVAETSFPQIGKAADEKGVGFPSLNGEGSSLKALLSSVKEDPSLKNALSSGVVSSLSTEQLRSLLNNLNDCPLTADCVPNALSKFLGDSSLSIANVDLTKANPYYCYYLDDQGYVSLSRTPDFTAKYSAEEIATLSEIVFSLGDSELRDVFSSATNSLSDGKIVKMKAILNYLSESYVFEKGHAWHWDNANQKALTSVTDDNALGVEDNLSVFEQLMFTFYDQIGLAERSFDIAYDYAVYKQELDKGLASEAAKNSAIKEKLYSALTTFDADSYLPSASRSGNTLHTGDWAMEIAALTNDGADGGLLHTMINNDNTKTYFTGSTSFTSGDLSNFKNVAPSTVGVVMRSLNQLDLVHDAVPYGIASLVEDSCLFRNYSIIEKNVAPIGALTWDSSSLFAIPVGHYVSLSVTMSSEVEPSVSASYSSEAGHDEYAISASHAAGTLEYSFDLGALYPNFFSVSSSVSIVSLTFAYNTSDYILSQADFLKANSAGKTFLEVIEDFANAVYVNGSYVSFNDAGSVQAFLAKDGTVAATLAYLRAEGGFYARRGYNDDYTAASDINAASFLSRDVTFRNMLRFAFSAGGLSGSVDFGQYFARERGNQVALCKNVKAALSDASFVNADEGQWIQDNLANLAKGDLLYGQAEAASYSYASMGFTYDLDVSNATKYAEMMAADNDDTVLTILEKGASSFLSDDSGANVVSVLGKYIASGFGDRLLAAEENYLTMDGTNSGFYLKLPTLVNPPATYGTSRTTLLPPSWAYPSFFADSFALLSNASNGGIALLNTLNSFERYVRLSTYLSGGTATMASADQSVIEGLLNDLDGFVNAGESSVVAMAELYYLSNIYDCFLNRGYVNSVTDRFYYVDSANTFAKAGTAILYA